MNLLSSAIDLVKAGFSVIPIDHRNKMPVAALLPTGPDGKRTWKPFQEKHADEATLKHWFADSSVQSMAVVCGKISGGLLIIDFDVPGFFERWSERADIVCDLLPAQHTGGGGYQVFLRCADPGPNQHLAWSPKPDAASGREIAIETRGEGGYAIVPPSLHPSGNRYRMIRERLNFMPTIEMVNALSLLQTARDLDEVPHSIQQLQRIARQSATGANSGRRQNDGHGDVIGAFNAAHDVATMLEQHGYVRKGARLVRPGGGSASVSILNGRSFHFSSNDPLNDGSANGCGCHDAFDLYCHLQHNGDVGAAVRAAAKLLNLPQRPRCQNPPKRTPAGDKTPDGDSAREVLSPAPPSPVSPQVSTDLRERSAFIPFPTHLLPAPVPQFIEDAAGALGCDEAMVALPLLCGLAVAIGTTRRIQLRKSWKEFPILWLAVVASSGQRKSPAFDAALEPLHQHQQTLYQEYLVEDVLYRQEELCYQRAIANFKKQNSGQPPEEPVKPVLKRLIVNDITIEALAIRMAENPRGLALVRDELAGWYGSFSRYRPDKGSDLAQWLELHRGGRILIDRKSATHPVLSVRRAAVSVCGTIQPGILARACGAEHFDSGLVGRTLFAMPPARQRRWSDRELTEESKALLASVYHALLGLKFADDDEPIDIPLSPEAKALFERFVNEHGAEQSVLGDDALEAAWSKLEGYAARLALIVHLVRVVQQQADPHLIDLQSMQAGIDLVRWFSHETLRVYGSLRVDAAERERMTLIDLIIQNGNQITPRQLARRGRKYRTAGAAEAALDELVRLKLGDWRLTPSGEQGGRPQRTFHRRGDSGDGDKTSLAIAPQRVLSPTATESEGSVTTPAAEPDPTDLDEEQAEREAIQWADGLEGGA